MMNLKELVKKEVAERKDNEESCTREGYPTLKTVETPAERLREPCQEPPKPELLRLIGMLWLMVLTMVPSTLEGFLR